MYNVIIDCDPGHDDAIALLLACQAENIKLLGVTTVAGNSYIENVTNNAIRVLEYADVKGVSVYQGAGRPMLYPLSQNRRRHSWRRWSRRAGNPQGGWIEAAGARR